MRRNIWKIVFLMVKSDLKDDLQVFLARRTEKVPEIMAALESDEDLFCELVENTLFLENNEIRDKEHKTWSLG